MAAGPSRPGATTPPTRSKRPWEKKRRYGAQFPDPMRAPGHNSADATEEYGPETLLMEEYNRVSSQHAEDDDQTRWVSAFDNDDNKSKFGALELSAATGNISDVRQRLLRPKDSADTPQSAFRAATVTGQIDVLRVLLKEAPEQLDDTHLLFQALLIATRCGQPGSIRFLRETLERINAWDQWKWSSTLMVNVSSGDPEAVLGFLRTGQPGDSPTLLDTLTRAIGAARAAKHWAVVHVLWHWLFDGTNEDCNDFSVYSMMTKHSKPGISLLERCLARTLGTLQIHGTNPNGLLSTSLGEVLAASLYSEGTDVVERVLLLMEHQNVDARSVMPAFASVCRDGLGTGGPILGRKTGPFALGYSNLLAGTYTAAVFGHCKVVCTLLHELLQMKATPSSTNPLDPVFVGAARHGHSDILTALLENSPFQSRFVDIQDTVNRGLLAAAGAGHLECVFVCIQAGADVNSFVSPTETMVHFDRNGGLAVELSDEDWVYLRRLRCSEFGIRLPTNQNGPSRHDELSLAGFTPNSIRTIHAVRNSHQPTGNALHTALHGFDRLYSRAKVCTIRAIDGNTPHEATIQREKLVSMILEQGCDPLKPDQFGQCPIAMAATWTNERVLRKLLNAGSFGSTPNSENKYQQLNRGICQACKNQSPTAFLMVVELLRCGARVPTTDDGQLTRELLNTLEQSTYLVKSNTFNRPYSFSVEDCRKFMESGMSMLLQLVFANTPPRQEVIRGELHRLMKVAATAGDQTSVELLLRYLKSADSWSSALCSAAEFGHLDLMRTLFHAGAEVKGEDYSGRGDIMEAAVVGGHVEAVKLLVQQTWVVQRSYHQPSILNLQGLAVKHKHLEALQYLVVVEGRVDVSALSAACRNGKMDFVAYLLSAIGEVTPNPLESDGSPLYFASFYGHVDISRLLIEHGTNVNQTFWSGTPLIVAASRRYMEVIRLLLDNGADPNQQCRVNNPYTTPSTVSRIIPSAFPLPPPGQYDGQKRRPCEGPASTALSIACSKGFLEVAELLLSRGAAILGYLDPETGMVPNAIASTCEGHWSPTKQTVLELLLETGSVQPNWPSAGHGGLSQAARAHNHTAFELIMEYVLPSPDTFVLASTCGSLPSITQHLNAGISPFTPNPEGELPLHSAAYNLHPSVVSHLLTHGGANPNQLDKASSSPLLSALLGFHALLHDKHKSHEHQADMGIMEFEEIAQCLLHHGARIEIGESPLGGTLDVARLIGHREIESLLNGRAEEAVGRAEEAVGRAEEAVALAYPFERGSVWCARGVDEDEGGMSRLEGNEGYDLEEQG